LRVGDELPGDQQADAEEQGDPERLDDLVEGVAELEAVLVRR
jgi:hypothetical protein